MMNALLLALALCGQLQAPLNDAACVYRAQPYDPGISVIPNEGTRTEPLVLGLTTDAEVSDPPYEVDPITGPCLSFTVANNGTCYIPAPHSAFEGSLTFAIRRRPLDTFALRTMAVFWNPQYGVKYFYMHQDTVNKYNSRFWTEDYDTNLATGSTNVSTQHADTVVAAWNAADRTNRLYVNGILEASNSSTFDRMNAPAYYPGVMQIPPPANSSPYNLTTNGKVGAIGIWNRALTDSEVIDLQLNEDWYSSGGPPPPHVGVFILRRNGVNEALPQGTVVKIDGVPVDPPMGSADKIIEVETP